MNYLNDLNLKVTNLPQGEKIASLDILRGIACLMVVIIHTTSIFLIEPSREAYRLLFSGLNTFAGSAVAIFVFISGMSLTLGYKDRNIRFWPFVKRRLLRVGLPFIIWGLFYAIVINRGIFVTHGPLALLGVLLGFSMYHLYYMVIIIQLYLIYPFLLKLHKSLPYIWLTVLCFLIGIWCEKQNIFIGPWRVTDRVFLTYLGYFSLGILTGLRQESWRGQLTKFKRPLAFIWLAVGCLATLQVYTYFSPWRTGFYGFGGYRYLIFAVASILFGYSITNWLSQPDRTSFWQQFKQTMVRMSEWSLDIYLVHPFLLAGMDWLWSRLPQQDSILRFCITFVFVLGGSIVFSWLKSDIIRLYKKKFIL